MKTVLSHIHWIRYQATVVDPTRRGCRPCSSTLRKALQSEEKYATAMLFLFLKQPCDLVLNYRGSCPSIMSDDVCA